MTKSKKFGSKSARAKRPAATGRRSAARGKTTAEPSARRVPAAAPAPSPAPSGAFAFADPKATPDDFTQIPKSEVYADTAAKATQALQPIRQPWRNPPVLDLGDVLGQSAVDQIQSAGRLVLHAFGDSGGVKAPAAQFAVADAIAGDLERGDYSTGRPAFLYHLGDVVYFFGQERYYYDQFYEPYRNYAAPIFAIPGNHDGVMFPGEQATFSLEGFWSNFCSQEPGHAAVAQGFSRTTMVQPGVYFTLTAPFLRVIGLYSNTSEGQTSGVISGGVVGTVQLDFLNAQLKAAALARKQGGKFALAIAVHHPPFTASAEHAPSPEMLKEIDAACGQAGIQPDIVLSGHAHVYERFTRVVGSLQIPFLVVGTGGYYNLSKMKTDRKGQPASIVRKATDAAGNALRLEASKVGSFGFLRLSVSEAEILGQFVAVDVPSGTETVYDSFTVDLFAHTVTTGAV